MGSNCFPVESFITFFMYEVAALTCTTISYVIMLPTEIASDDSAIGIMCDDVFGKGWGSFKIAHLSTGDKIGVEIFEFKNAEQRENNFEYWKMVCFTSTYKI